MTGDPMTEPRDLAPIEEPNPQLQETAAQFWFNRAQASESRCVDLEARAMQAEAEVARLRSLLPQQITAAEELEALPLGAKVLNAVGECFEVQDGRRFHGLDGITTGAANAFERWGAFSPLSVVWRPERTEP